MNDVSQWQERATDIGLCETAHPIHDAASTLHMADARGLVGWPTGAAIAGINRVRHIEPVLRQHTDRVPGVRCA